MARGIKDKVAILGMGCSKFGERWDSGAEELMLEAYKECLKDAGIDQNQLQAAWFSTAIDEVHVGKSGIPLSTTLRLPDGAANPYLMQAVILAAGLDGVRTKADPGRRYDIDMYQMGHTVKNAPKLPLNLLDALFVATAQHDRKTADLNLSRTMRAVQSKRKL